MNIQQIDFKCMMVASTTDSTLSRLWVQKLSEQEPIEQRGLCWILEDGHREVKEKGKTRIPAGRYRVRPTRDSKFYTQYKNDPSLKFKYVLTLEGVPNFSLIRIHAGIDVDDTDGCPLTGLATNLDVKGNFCVSRSKEALKRVHRQLDLYFDEKGMDFRVPVWWEIGRVPLIQFVTLPTAR